MSENNQFKAPNATLTPISNQNPLAAPTPITTASYSNPPSQPMAYNPGTLPTGQYAPIPTDGQQYSGYPQQNPGSLPGQPYQAQPAYIAPGQVPPQYTQPGVPYPTGDPKAPYGSYPPQTTAYVITSPPVNITLAEHQTNIQAGFWPGCLGGFCCGCFGLLTLLFFQQPIIQPGGDMKPAAVARANQAGALYGVASGLCSFIVIWIVLIIVAVVSVSNYYSGYGYSVTYYNYTVVYYGVLLAIWGGVAGVIFYFGRQRSDQIKKEFNIIA
ncbi:hypothetical protein HK098_005234 [Nowakowskiella sp. JEL0407]|nr:hypothetical protein HK098_005234 [Nowakowskiella sp. JEL0407]